MSLFLVGRSLRILAGDETERTDDDHIVEVIDRARRARHSHYVLPRNYRDCRDTLEELKMTLHDRASTDLRLARSAIQVLAVLVTSAGERGCVRITQAEIANRIGGHEKTVKRSLDALEAAGYITREHAESTRRGTVLFLVNG